MLLFLDSLGQRGAHVAPYTDESFEARSVSERRRALRSAKACLASQHQAQQRSSALLRERMAALDDELAALDGGENDGIENHLIGEEGGADGVGEGALGGESAASAAAAAAQSLQAAPQRPVSSQSPLAALEVRRQAMVDEAAAIGVAARRDEGRLEYEREGGVESDEEEEEEEEEEWGEEWDEEELMAVANRLMEEEEEKQRQLD